MMSASTEHKCEYNQIDLSLFLSVNVSRDSCLKKEQPIDTEHYVFMLNVKSNQAEEKKNYGSCQD